MKKKIILIAVILVIAVAAILICDSYFGTKNIHDNGGGGGGGDARIEPLSDADREKVVQKILSSEFLDDIPEKYPISLRFFKFEEGQRIWQDNFILGSDQLLSSGNPGIRLTLHSKYISELDDTDLCTIIQAANKNRDLGFDSEYSTTSLLLKYRGMLEHRECFGF